MHNHLERLWKGIHSLLKLEKKRISRLLGFGAVAGLKYTISNVFSTGKQNRELPCMWLSYYTYVLKVSPYIRYCTV